MRFTEGLDGASGARDLLNRVPVSVISLHGALKDSGVLRETLRQGKIEGVVDLRTSNEKRSHVANAAGSQYAGQRLYL